MPVGSALKRARRRLNRAFYRLLARTYRTLFRSDAPHGRIPAAAVRRLLLVRHDALGDMAVTLPALSYLRAALPHAEIDVVASPRNAALLRGDSRVARVVVHDGSLGALAALVPRLRARRYDVIVSPLMRRGLREGLFACLVSHRTTARVSPWRKRRYVGLFTHLVRVRRAERHLATRLLAVVQRAIGDGHVDACADVRAYLPALTPPVDADAPTGFVALNAWAAEPHRDLGVALATALASGLAERGYPVVLTPPPGREADAAAIAAAAPARVAPPGSIADLLAVLRRAAVVVTPDTANVHLASALGTPVVSLHTPIGADVRDWGPWGVPNRTVVLSDARPLREARVADVLAAFDALRVELND